MKLKTNYVLPHKSKGWAFLDGTLCGLVLAAVAKIFYNEYLELKDLEARIAEAHAEEAAETTDSPT